MQKFEKRCFGLDVARVWRKAIGQANCGGTPLILQWQSDTLALLQGFGLFVSFDARIPELVAETKSEQPIFRSV